MAKDAMTKLTDRPLPDQLRDLATWLDIHGNDVEAEVCRQSATRLEDHSRKLVELVSR